MAKAAKYFGWRVDSDWICFLWLNGKAIASLYSFLKKTKPLTPDMRFICSMFTILSFKRLYR